MMTHPTHHALTKSLAEARAEIASWRTVAECNQTTAQHWQARATAAEAEVERLTRERDEAAFERDAAASCMAAAETARDAAEAERDALRTALIKIAGQCPETQPPPAWDEWGDQIADTSDRHADRVSAQNSWHIGCLARAALAKTEGGE